MTTETKTSMQMFAEKLRLAASSADALNEAIGGTPIQSRVFAYANDGIVTVLTDSTGARAAEIMRHVYGGLKLQGFEMTTEKIDTAIHGDEEFIVHARKGDLSIKLKEWMPKSCRIVEETVTIPAQPAREAVPEQVRVRRRIICEND